MAYFGDGSKWGVEIEYSLEDMPLGTIGPLKLIKDLPDNFLVMNGDVLSDINYAAFLEKHSAVDSKFTRLPSRLLDTYQTTNILDLIC